MREGFMPHIVGNFSTCYNIALKLTSIKGLHKKVWISKVAGVPILGILGVPTWESRDKWHLGATLMASHRNYYKGEGGGFPQIWFVVNLVSSCMSHGSSMHQKCSNYALTNLLFGLCKSIQIIDPLATCFNPHPIALAHPFYPQNPNFFFVVFILTLALKSFKEFWGVSTIASKNTHL